MKKEIGFSFIFGGLSGILVGLLVSLVFSYASETGFYYPSTPEFMEHFSNQNTALLLSIGCWYLLGTIPACAGFIFKYTDWSISKMTIIHCILLYTSILGISIVMKWIEIQLLPLSLFTFIFVGIYVIIWFIWMYFARLDIKEINKKIS